MNVTWLKSFAAVLALLGALPVLAADTQEASIDQSERNLLVVLRESPGANKLEEGLQPFGKLKTQLADGREVEFEASWYQFLGDLHLRLVFDAGQQIQSAVPEDLQRLSLTPEQALQRAVRNMRERFGAPVAQPWSGGLMQVGGDDPDLNSSYLLDREFWMAQLREHPQGVVVAVPRRAGLVFGPADDDMALVSLRFSAAALYNTNTRTRLSSALYLFKDGRWSVFQPPQAPLD